MNQAPRLTCLQCRSRKRKCDKEVPCGACRQAGLKCEVVQRARLPRGRSAKRNALGTPLETRVARIEGLLSKAQASSATESPHHHHNNNGSHLPPYETLPNIAEHDDSQPPGRMGDYMAPDFWAALSQEVAGLRETFEDSDEEDAIASTEDQDGTPSSMDITLFGIRPYEDPDQAVPSPNVRSLLLDMYHQRVDIIYKILHWPTITARIEGHHSGFGNIQLSPAERALEAAIYFMGLCTLSDLEFEHYNLGDRPKMLERYQALVELRLSEGKLIQSPNFTALQAFAVYLLGLRTCRSCASSWTLLAVAVRTASALGLGAEDPQRFTPFDLELRRRLWYCICILDIQAGLDRGSVDLISSSALGPPPLDINDHEMSPAGGVSAVPGGGRFTEMSHSLMAYEGVICYKHLVHISNIAQDQWNGWEQKVQVIAAFEQRMRQKYFNIPDSATVQERLTKLGAQGIVPNMQLLLRRPPYRQKVNCVPPWDNFDPLAEANHALEQHLQIQDDEFAPWAWKSWVQWHPLAVVLAELCSKPHGPLSDRAYPIACQSFERYSRVVADTDSGMLWKPIAKLMRRVQRLRGDTPDTTPTPPAPPVAFQNLEGQPYPHPQYGIPVSMPPHQGMMDQAAMVGPFGMGQPTAPSHRGSFQQAVPYYGVVPEDGTSWMNWDVFLEDVTCPVEMF